MHGGAERAGPVQSGEEKAQGVVINVYKYQGHGAGRLKKTEPGCTQQCPVTDIQETLFKQQNYIFFMHT